MNLPNKLTVARMVIVPFFVALLLNFTPPHHYLYAAILFGAAAITDHFDGKIARKNNQVTNFGKFLDPVADKILVIGALACFVQLGLTSAWFLILIIMREFIVTSIRLLAVDDGVVIAANIWGKAKTVSQLVAIIVILVLQYIQELMAMNVISSSSFGCDPAAAFQLTGNILIGIATLLTLYSGLIYVKNNIRFINSSK